jgi:predicted dehydrogenase
VDNPVVVGLVGAGPWARAMHAPVLAAGPETRLAGVWGRRAHLAEALASRYAVAAARTFEELLDRCEAVAFAVPPRVQAELAGRAARAGKALLLDKPIAETVGGARRLVADVEAAGVVTALVLTKRYHPLTRAFLREAATFPVTGARAAYLHGGSLTGEWAGTWRETGGALLDLGPHVLDLLDAAVGPIGAVRATGDPARWAQIVCEHRNGAVSEASLSASVSAAVMTVELYGPSATLTYDARRLDHAECWPVLRREFAAAVRAGTPSDLDVRRGLLLQELIERARTSGGGRDG